MQIETGRLRKITRNDLDMILKWRNSERIHKNMLTDHKISKEEHYSWYTNLDNKTDLYLVFELNTYPMGLVYFNDIQSDIGECSWGFYLGEANLPHGTGLLLGFLGLNYAFSRLDVNTIWGSVLNFNQKSISFHKKLGFVENKVIKQGIYKNGKSHDLIIFSLDKEIWKDRSILLEKELRSR